MKSHLMELAEDNHSEHCTCGDWRCIACRLLLEVKQSDDGLELVAEIERRDKQGLMDLLRRTVGPLDALGDFALANEIRTRLERP